MRLKIWKVYDIKGMMGNRIERIVFREKFIYMGNLEGEYIFLREGVKEFNLCKVGTLRVLEKDVLEVGSISYLSMDKNIRNYIEEQLKKKKFVK